MKVQSSKFFGHAKAMLQGKFKALNVYIRKEEKFYTSNRSSILKKLEKEEQNTPTAIRRKEIIKIREVIKEIGNKNNRENQGENLVL